MVIQVSRQVVTRGASTRDGCVQAPERCGPTREFAAVVASRPTIVGRERLIAYAISIRRVGSASLGREASRANRSTSPRTARPPKGERERERERERETERRRARRRAGELERARGVCGASSSGSESETLTVRVRRSSRASPWWGRLLRADEDGYLPRDEVFVDEAAGAWRLRDKAEAARRSSREFSNGSSEESATGCLLSGASRVGRSPPERRLR